MQVNFDYEIKRLLPCRSKMFVLNLHIASMVDFVPLSLFSTFSLVNFHWLPLGVGYFFILTKEPLSVDLLQVVFIIHVHVYTVYDTKKLCNLVSLIMLLRLTAMLFSQQLVYLLSERYMQLREWDL